MHGWMLAAVPGYALRANPGYIKTGCQHEHEAHRTGRSCASGNCSCVALGRCSRRGSTSATAPALLYLGNCSCVALPRQLLLRCSTSATAPALLYLLHPCSRPASMPSSCIHAVAMHPRHLHILVRRNPGPRHRCGCAMTNTTVRAVTQASSCICVLCGPLGFMHFPSPVR